MPATRIIPRIMSVYSHGRRAVELHAGKTIKRFRNGSRATMLYPVDRNVRATYEDSRGARQCGCDRRSGEGATAERATNWLAGGRQKD
jgi:hypothetical protein